MSEDAQPVDRDPSPDDDAGRVLSVHVGHSANCSSVGSFIDFLFVSSVVGAAVLGAFTILVRRSAKTDADADADPDADADADSDADADTDEGARE